MKKITDSSYSSLKPSEYNAFYKSSGLSSVKEHA